MKSFFGLVVGGVAGGGALETFFFFFFNDTAPTEIYTLSLHDALPICGKKRRHTQKAQVIADLNTQKILATEFGNGSKHDFQLFKDSRCVPPCRVRIVADTGYQGLLRLHANSQTPTKKSQHHPLTKEQRAANRALSRVRIVIENILRKLKIFRILSERYRNRRKRF